MTGKLLSREELELLAYKWNGATVPESFDIRALLAHIAALEADRDGWRRLAEKAEKTAAEVVADNAALLNVIIDAGEALRKKRKPSAHFVAISMVGHIQCANGHPGAALLDEHRKALVRARNEGLEESAQEVGSVAAKPFPDSEARMLLDYAMDRIRALKEPE
jgi:hypothetical protein